MFYTIERITCRLYKKLISGCHYLPVCLFSVTMSILRHALFNVWINVQEKKNKAATVISYVLSKIGVREDTNEKCKKVKRMVHKFVHDLGVKWQNSNRSRKYFEAKNKNWLNGAIDFAIPYTDSEEAEPSASVTHLIKKTFAEKSKRSKLLDVSSLVKAKSCEELVLAAKVSLYKSGKRDAAKMFDELNASPTRATQIKKKCFPHLTCLFRTHLKRPWLCL